MKTVLSQEREKERAERERKRQEKLDAMDVDGSGDNAEEEIPTCK